jgi:hypothetical protein
MPTLRTVPEGAAAEVAAAPAFEAVPEPEADVLAWHPAKVLTNNAVAKIAEIILFIIIPPDFLIENL